MGGACGNCEEEEEGKDLDQMHVFFLLFLFLYCLLVERTSVKLELVIIFNTVSTFILENLEPTHHSGDWMPSIYNLTPRTVSMMN